MKLKKRTYIEHLFFICVILQLIIMLLANAVLKNALVLVYGTFVLDILAIGIAFVHTNFKIRLPQREIPLIFLFLVSQMMMYLITSLCYDTLFMDFHKLILCVGLIYACYFAADTSKCSPDKLETIFNLIIYFGLIASIYNLIINFGYIRLVKLTAIMYYAWGFTSFFSTRAVYGTFLTICAIITLYKSERNSIRAYWLLFFWLSINVIITAARAQCLALIIGSVIYLTYSKKYRKFVIFGIFVAIIYLVFTGISNFSEITEKYYMYFDHSQGRETDISTGRFELWGHAMQAMNLWNWPFGNGLGSKDTLMSIKEIKILGAQLYSFHSGYVDLFFETGILGIVIWARYIKKTLYNLAVCCPKRIRCLFISIIMVILVACLFDGCFLPFTADTMAIFSSFIIFALPKSVANYYVDER